MATLAALGALAAGCAQPRTQIVVRLDSDYSPIAGELSSIEVVVRSQDAQERSRYSFSVGTSEATAIRGFPVELFAIEPLGGDATRVTSVEVSPVQGQRLFTVRASASFQRGRTTVLTVYLSRACAAQTTPCPSGQTCGRDGACTSFDRGPLPELDASIATMDAADAQPATCVLQCCRGRTVGPLLAPSEESCRSLYPTCADYGFVRSTTFNGAVVYARDERCWAKCANRMAFHEVTATMSSCATEAARYCATNADRGPLQRSEWNACEPFAL